ncbi:hypothetical protein [Hymenobacter glacieicola]|uniref:Uncharacterized protein n=1 Tax=Hymenobacter glacieicola TaxID=1562124 RepID=A0ABQ1X2C0_9BACT|nr:hypothetical protein [Hymenobacter glacieicola]GGG56507.1 hypothetical protein GCM10011378_35860 [Hymenobacter glacieicola]
MAASSAPDSFLQKPTEELLFLVQHPELYHPSVVAEAGRELRRRGTSLPPTPAPGPAATPEPVYHEPEPAAAGMARWWPAGVLAAAVLGLGWWGLHSPTAPAATSAPVAAKKAEPIVLEAVKTERLPDFEAKTAAQVAELRRLLPAADRADTTATGRYLRMARRYWLAENAAAHLTSQARTGAVTAVFPGQVDLTQERIAWFMRAKAYNQHLTATMEERLNLMQQGLKLRRSSLQVFKSRYEAQMQLMDPQEEKLHQEATGLAEELRGHYQRKQPLRGNITEL